MVSEEKKKKKYKGGVGLCKDKEEDGQVQELPKIPINLYLFTSPRTKAQPSPLKKHILQKEDEPKEMTLETQAP